jgi:hypothetical protein
MTFFAKYLQVLYAVVAPSCQFYNVVYLITYLAAIVTGLAVQPERLRP